MSDASEAPPGTSDEQNPLSSTSDLVRWRLVLGRYAGDGLGAHTLKGDQARMEAALDYLYDREYEGRGIRPELGPGSLEDSAPTLVSWLGEVRELFPRETAEVIEKHALDRYGLTELVTDRETLERLEPNEQLLKTLLAVKGHIAGDVLEVARRIIRQVVDELRRRLELDACIDYL